MADLIDRGNRIGDNSQHCENLTGYWQAIGLQKAFFRLSE